MPRTILALYDGRAIQDIRDGPVHRLLEMPLNHLGLIVRYQDVNSGTLPKPTELAGVRGIVTWLEAEGAARPREFLGWVESALDTGLRMVVIGSLGISGDAQVGDAAAAGRILARIGVRGGHGWSAINYAARVVHRNPVMIGFERPLPAVLPPFESMKPSGPGTASHLVVRRGNDGSGDSHLVVTGPRGGYVAGGYTHYQGAEMARLQWYLNPFEFFRLAFATDEIPKPDTTTLSGRRIYYSHIDGDGWRNRTEAPRHRAARLSAAEVVLREAIEPFPDLPVTVGPIAGDLDPAWRGGREPLQVARRFFALPWVEAGSHTYSHPLDWEALAVEEAKAPASAGVLPSAMRALEFFAARWIDSSAVEGPKSRRGHTQLRSYDLYPFSLEREIAGPRDDCQAQPAEATNA